MGLFQKHNPFNLESRFACGGTRTLMFLRKFNIWEIFYYFTILANPKNPNLNLDCTDYGDFYLPPAAEGRGREIIKRLPSVRASDRASVCHIFA